MIPPLDVPGSAAPTQAPSAKSRSVFGFTVWAMVAFGMLCIVAGVGVANLGPRLFPLRSASKAIVPVASTTQAPTSSLPVPAPVPVAPPPALPSPDVERLAARVTSLEAQQAHTSQAAAAALAASVVVEASQGTAPFAEELESLRVISPPSPELQSLARLAQVGAPSRTALAASFPDYAARAASAGHAPGDKAGLGDRIVYALSRIVSLRRVGDASGDGVDGVLALAERQVEDGDLDHALRTLDRLPPAARDAMAPWRDRAERRAEIDRNAQALRAQALQALAAEARGGA
ncbi:hypothetical protein [Phenylobacterium sp.]|jgi:hypothetical protein|uniref:COG4223 family protein n=1 Tax=Phenylobacterium sp. TaxID=1871053 RepID=UPI002F3FFC1A